MRCLRQFNFVTVASMSNFFMVTGSSIETIWVGLPGLMSVLTPKRMASTVGLGGCRVSAFLMLADGADIEVSVERNLPVQFGDAALDIHTRIEVGVLHQRLWTGPAYAGWNELVA